MTAAQWQSFAVETAGKIAHQAKPLIDDQASFFVEPLDSRVPFTRAFQEYLISALMERGLQISFTRNGSYRVHYAIQTISHSYGSIPKGDIFDLSAVGIIGWEAADSSGQDWPLYVAGAIIAEALNDSDYEAKDELLITVSLVRGDNLYGRISNTYYIDKAESYQYVNAKPASPLMIVAGSQNDIALDVRKFQIVSGD